MISANASRRCRRTAVLLLAALLSPRASSLLAAAAPYLAITLDQVRVEYAQGGAGLARQALEATQYARDRIGKELGLSTAGLVTVQLAPDRGEFDRLCGARMPEWALAAALGGRRTVVVNLSKVAAATPNDMNLALFHEVVHVALDEAERTAKSPLPRWFHEGVANRLSGQRHLRLNDSAFSTAAARGRLIPLDRIAADFPVSATESELAYLESEKFVAYVQGSCGPEALRWIMQRFRAGEPFDDAFEHALGLSRAQMERQWAQSLKRRFPWLYDIWAVTTLFGLMALATIAIFLVVRWRGERLKREWAREERIWTVAGEEEDEQEPGAGPRDDEEEWEECDPEEDDWGDHDWDIGRKPRRRR